eukprot:CAMPEP_0170423210 /NCGR_PEP_ID=MMETSP0117_2-20130122/36878_1 /TAXON_ID=400756 /ORGANISM="Durinskia baltica, Strain CSIRO CS-38" /LENGTH=121 /DNA_ID=CAMNT_0010681947 /DNA_START=269 /DNA_END=631 /DNA_ORIENTATION=+
MAENDTAHAAAEKDGANEAEEDKQLCDWVQVVEVLHSLDQAVGQVGHEAGVRLQLLQLQCERLGIPVARRGVRPRLPIGGIGKGGRQQGVFRPLAHSVDGLADVSAEIARDIFEADFRFDA